MLFCFVFRKHSSNKIYSLKLYHVLNVALLSKANVCTISTFNRFSMQMQVEKTKKHLPIDYIGHSNNGVIFEQNRMSSSLFCCYVLNFIYRSHALKSRSKLRAAIGLRDAFWKSLSHQNSSLCTVTVGEKVLTLAKSRGYGKY